MIWWHKEGQRVVAISDWPVRRMRDVPQMDKCYTVREVLASGGRIGFKLIEIVNSYEMFYDVGCEEIAFSVTGFRPATDISSLLAIARKVTDSMPLREDADVTEEVGS